MNVLRLRGLHTLKRANRNLSFGSRFLQKESSSEDLEALRARETAQNQAYQDDIDKRSKYAGINLFF